MTNKDDVNRFLAEAASFIDLTKGSNFPDEFTRDMAKCLRRGMNVVRAQEADLSGPTEALWITRFICCGWETSWGAWDTWDEADQQRTWWVDSSVEGHERVTFVYEAAKPQRQGHHARIDTIPSAKAHS